MSSRNVSSKRHAKSVVDRKRFTSAGTSPQKTRSSKDGDVVIKSCATKSRDPRKRQLLTRKENKMVHDDVKHKVRLFDETNVASADNNDEIYILRKEIHDWRMSGHLTGEFEPDCHLIEDETETNFVQGNYDQVVASDPVDPGVLHKLPSSTIVDQLTRRTENSSSPETTCNDEVCPISSSLGEMTSVRTCYCKQAENVARKKDNDIRIHNGNRHPTTVRPKKLIISSRISRNDGESSKKEKYVIDEKIPSTSRSVEVQTSDPILSPETSATFENVEKIIDNAKTQLMEICARPSFDSARQNKNIYFDDLPLDNEEEELQYVRELVASKMQEATSSRLSEANGKASARSEERDRPRPPTVRRVNLSAPKFQMPRRRYTDWLSLGYRSDRSRERASLAQVPSKGSIEVATERIEATARDVDRARDHRRTSSTNRENECEVQIGPSVHIDDRKLIRQDLEEVHISPESSRAQNRTNTATYTLRHDVAQIVDNEVNDPKISKTPKKIVRMRLDALQEGKPIETAIETETIDPLDKSEKDLEEVRNFERGGERIESPKQEKRDREPDRQDVEDKRASEHRENASQGAAKSAEADENEELKNNSRNHEEITSGDTKIAKEDEIFREGSVDRLRNVENAVGKIQEEKQGDRSKPLPAGDTSRKANFPRCGNIAARYREAESPRPYRTIDGHFSHTFNSHNGQDSLHDVADEDVRRRLFVASDCSDVLPMENNLDEIDLYRPRLDELNSILQFNDRKIERIVRTTKNLAELLSSSEFAIYKDEEERVPRDESRKVPQDCQTSADKDLKYSSYAPTRSSILEIDLRNEDLTVSRASETPRTGENLQDANMDVKSSKGDDSRGNYSRNSVESSLLLALDSSDDFKTSRDNDRARGSTAEARLSESSMDKSDITFSNLVPALSSTHTESQTCRHRQQETARSDHHADTRSHDVTSANKVPFKRELQRSGKEHPDDGIFARFTRKDTSETADRFVTYILQDEKQSIEGKLRNALKESAIKPAVVRKLLDRLLETESIRDARQTETLDILRDILINVKNQSDRGNTNDKETRDIPDISARANAPSNAIDGSTLREEAAREKIDASEIGQVAKNSQEGVKDTEKYSCDFSECRETKESARSTARCESIRCSKNNSERDRDETEEGADVARVVPIDAENQTKIMNVNENGRKEEEAFLGNIADSLMQINALSNAIEESILRTQAKINTSDLGQIADKPNDIRDPEKYFPDSSALRETREIVRSGVHFESARGSKNNSKNNSKGNSCSEAESLKQISDIHSDDNQNPKETSEHLSAQIVSARSKEGHKMVAVDSNAGNAILENKEDETNAERIGEDELDNKDQHANKAVTQADEAINGRSDIPKEIIKEITSGETHDNVTSADKRALFFSEASEIKDERVHPDASSAEPKLVDEAPAKTDVVNFVYSSAKKDAESSHGIKTDPQYVIIEEKIDITNLQEIETRNEQISFKEIAGKDDSTGDTRNEEIRGTFATIENRRDGNDGFGKTAINGNERQSIDLTDRPRKYRTDVLSSSNSSVSSTVLDHDDRSINDVSSGNARRIETTLETSHSEGELYMPSSCSYSLGEVRVLRRKRDLIENSAIDRCDSSVTVFVTKSMLTSLNDSTMSLLESSGRV